MSFTQLFSDKTPLSNAEGSPKRGLRRDHAQRLMLIGELASPSESSQGDTAAASEWLSRQKPNAEALLDEGGPQGLETYLQQHPNSARRIQGELRGQTLLGRAASPPTTRANKPTAEEILDRGLPRL